MQNRYLSINVSADEDPNNNDLDVSSKTPKVGLEPCNYIRGFILLEYTLRFNELQNLILIVRLLFSYYKYKIIMK